MGDEAADASRMMKLRYSGRCRICGASIPAGTMATYDPKSKTVECLQCPIDPSATSSLEVSDVLSSGVAGASAKREYQRRKSLREERIRGAHPILGDVILALSDDPQSTRAWSAGARGEERLGRLLDGIVGPSVRVFHDRRIVGTRSNIDHIVVCSTGVHVIDAKRYLNRRPSLRVEGGFIRPRSEKLMVGSRDHTKLVGGVHKQVDLVGVALDASGFVGIPATGTLCFVEADWPLFGGDFTVANVRVLWPKKALERVQRPGSLSAATIEDVARALAEAFPSS